MLTTNQNLLDPNVVQKQLRHLYDQWRTKLHADEAWFEGAVPPHLLRVTVDYCRAPIRILFYGQETRGWGPHDGKSFDCFIGGDCSTEELLSVYEKFNFASGTPVYKTLFWRAFRRIQSLEGSGVLWANLCKVAFDNGNKHSFLNAPAERRKKFVVEQTSLMRAEVDILRPHAVVFVTRPYYDHILKEVFDVERFDKVVADLSSSQLGRVVSRFLPPVSFRTYHPNFLNRDAQVRWRWLEEARAQIAQIAQSLSPASVLNINTDY